MTPTDTVEDQMVQAILRIWMGSVTVSSNFAREQAAIIAACASEGYLTTRIGRGIYTPSWLVTPVGLEFLQDHHPEIEF